MIREEYIEEIKKRVLSAKLENVYNVDFETKEGKDTSFPSFDDVYAYVDKSSGVDKFFERIDAALTKYKNFVHGDGLTKVGISAKPLLKRVVTSEETINKILAVFDNKIDFDELPDHKIKKVIKTSFKEEYSDALNFLFELLCKLSKKAKDYIVRNSIYTSAYKIEYEESRKELKKADPLPYLTSVTEKVKDVVDKPYTPDFLSDGTEDLEEMMAVFWNGMEALLYFTQPIEVASYEIDGEKNIKDIKEWYKKELADHFACLDEKLSDSYFEKYNDAEIRTRFDKVLKIKVPKEINPRTGSEIEASGKCAAELKLAELIGLASVKEAVEKIKAYAKMHKGKSDLNLHMAFYGNPGTGKTEVAKLLGEILHEYGVLPKKKYVEATRRDLVSPWVGATAIKTHYLVEEAMGGVLFIDEAYSLVHDNDSHDTGAEAVAELIKSMEDYKGKFCVVLAGYKNEMKKMLAVNPGFNSRIQFHIDFENYDRDEMGEIMKLMLEHDGYTTDEATLNKMLDVSDVFRKGTDFANARTARNIVQQCEMCLSARVTSPDDKVIILDDVNKYIQDSKLNLPIGPHAEGKILSGEEQLNALIGLGNVKLAVKKIKAYAKKNKGAPNLNLHMAFTGNPGTGKSEVANIISRILFEAGVLPEAKVVLGNRETLVGRYVGETAIKTKEAVQKAMGGVLFVDEAYSLTDNCKSSNDFGPEAIAALIDEMEKNKGKFAVVLAGYEGPLMNMIATNPGFKSRIQFYINFPDYSRDELRQIALSFLSKETVPYKMTYEAIEEMLDITDLYRSQPDFANARTVRTMLQDIIMNQNLRTEEDEGNDEIIIDDVKEYETEKGLVLHDAPKADESFSKDVIDQLVSASASYDSSKSDVSYYEQPVVLISDGNAQGTGFIVTPDGLCMTCAHCVKGDGSSQKARITMALMNGQKFQNYVGFKVLFMDEKNDFALLKLDSMGMNYMYLPLTLEQDCKYEPLQPFIMPGYPFGGETYTSLSVTEGKVASVNTFEGREVVFADMFGKPGNSGSPVIDAKTKKVIGIFWGAIVDSASQTSISSFTPAHVIWKSLKN